MTPEADTPYIPETAAEVPRTQSSKVEAWSRLEALILVELAQGPRTTRALKDAMESQGFRAEQIGKAVSTRWMDLPRHPGRTSFAPWTVYHPFSPDAARLGIAKAVDSWLLEWFRGNKGAAVRSTVVLREAEKAGFDAKALETAYRRLGIPARKDGSHWYRQLSVDAIAALDAIKAGA